jgi:hypothetical protein
MSVLPLKADMRQREWHVRYVPSADIICRYIDHELRSSANNQICRYIDHELRSTTTSAKIEDMDDDHFTGYERRPH